jgi:hypothetical protein
MPRMTSVADNFSISSDSLVRQDRLVTFCDALF